ncbi:MAG: endonuclease MutS2 [Ruminococcus callidus]
MNKNLEILEFHKILDMLANLSANDITREKVLAITPNPDLAEARAELEKTNDAFQLSIQFGAPPFHRFQDMRMGLRRAKSGAKLSLKDLLEIATILRQMQSLSDWYDRCAGVESTLDDLFSQLAPVPFLLEKLDRSILSEEEIADAASPALAEIRRKIGRSRQKLRDTLDSMMRRQEVQDCLQDNRVTLRDGRFVLPVRAEHRSKIAGLVHDTSATGQTIFIEPIAVVDANNDIRLLELQEAEEIERIIEELCTECGTWADTIIRDIAVCADLNVYFAKARLAEQMHAFPPTLTDDGVILLKKARHPLIPYKKAVPISFTLGDTYQALIITGPNTGGKTVALKTCGLLTLMAMSGMLIPAAEGSRISVFNNVLADIGDTQSIEQNLSTFSAHMRSVIEILEQADRHSLVLLDELGSGTDPIEGAALAEAVIQRLKDNGAKLMVTTHYQELKLYATEQPDVQNASCEFDIETLRPTYRLILGSPESPTRLPFARGWGCRNRSLPRRKRWSVRKICDLKKRFQAGRNPKGSGTRPQCHAGSPAAGGRRCGKATGRSPAYPHRPRKHHGTGSAGSHANRGNHQGTVQRDDLRTGSAAESQGKGDFRGRCDPCQGQRQAGLPEDVRNRQPADRGAGRGLCAPAGIAGRRHRHADRHQAESGSCRKAGQERLCLLQIGAMRTKVPQEKLRLVAGAEEKKEPAETAADCRTGFGSGSQTGHHGTGYSRLYL